MNYTKKQLTDMIRRMGIQPDDSVMIHASMKSIGNVEGGADTVLDAWMEYLSEGLFMMPAHTWAQMGPDCRVFDPQSMPSCVGLLTNLFRMRPGVVTDLHITLPTYYPNFPWMDIRMGKMVSSYDPFVMDYEHYGAFQLSPNSILSTFSTYNTYPTMGTIIQSGADFIYRPNERWELTGGMYTAKYTIPSRMHGSQFDIGLDASAAYRINNFLRIRFFGQYSGFGKQNSLNGYMNPMYPQSHYGVVMEVKINDYLEIQGGVERAYNASKMKWETVPILAPVIHLNRKKK